MSNRDRDAVDQRTAPMTVEDRIKRWRLEDAGRETEGVIELLVDAEDELRRLRAKVGDVE